MSETVATTGITRDHLEFEFDPINAITYEGVIMGRIYRDGTNPADTYIGDVAITSFELKYIANKLGADS